REQQHRKELHEIGVTQICSRTGSLIQFPADNDCLNFRANAGEYATGQEEAIIPEAQSAIRIVIALHVHRGGSEIACGTPTPKRSESGCRAKQAWAWHRFRQSFLSQLANAMTANAEPACVRKCLLSWLSERVNQRPLSR